MAGEGPVRQGDLAEGLAPQAPDALVDEVREALAPAGGGRFYACGLFACSVAAGRSPGAMLLRTDSDVEATARAIARAEGRTALAPRPKAGVFWLPESGGRPSVVVAPLADGGIEEQLRRAPFTCTAMAVDLFGGDLIDPLAGADDLAAGRLRLAREGADLAGPATVLNAVQLCYSFSLQPDGEAEAALKSSAARLKGARSDRIRHVLLRMMDAGVAEKAVMLERMGASAALLPELHAEVGVPQNYFHHLGVWEHTLETLEILERLLEALPGTFKAYGPRLEAHFSRRLEGIERRRLLMFAALVHDIGKVATMKVEPSGRIRFKGHQVEGGALARGIASRLGFGHRCREYISGLVTEHMGLGFLIKEGESARSRLRLITRLGSLAPDVAILSLADRLATRGEASTEEGLERYRRVVNRVIADHYWNADCPVLIEGRDVLLQGEATGREVREALFEVRAAQRDGTVADHEQAIEYLAPGFKGKMAPG